MDDGLKKVKIKKITYIDSPQTVCDLTIADNHNLFACSKIRDSQILAHNCIDENIKMLNKIISRKIKPYALDFISEQYGCSIYRQIEFSKGNRGQIATEGLTKRFIEYASFDVIVPLHIMDCQLAEAKRQNYKKFLKAVCEQLSDTILAFSLMEHNGALIDRKHLMKLKAKDGPISTIIAQNLEKFKDSEAAKRVNAFLMKRQGVPEYTLFSKGAWLFDINKQAHKQLLFFKALKLKPLGATKAGGGKVDKAFQEKYKDNPVVKIYNNYSKTLTIRNNFVNGIYERLNTDPDAKADSRIRSSYDYTEISTSRSGSSKPNLQNIPARGDLSYYIKRLFIAAPGSLMLEDDFSAHEIRDWANEAGDENLAAAFYAGLKYRQELRLISYSNPEEAKTWFDYKNNNNWKDIKGEGAYNKKKAIIDKLNNPIVTQIANIDLELELKGDVHKQNCLSGDSLIPTNKGLIRLDSLVEKIPLNKWTNISYKVPGRYTPARTNGIIYKGKKQIWEVHTEHGNKLKSTLDHKYLIFNIETGQTEYKILSKCKEGDFLCINHTQITRKSKLRLNLSKPDLLASNNSHGITGVYWDKSVKKWSVEFRIDSKLHRVGRFLTFEEAVSARIKAEYRYKISGNRSIFKAKKPKYMTPDLAFAIGLIISEGCLYSGNGYYIQVGNGNYKLLSKYCTCIRNVFGIDELKITPTKASMERKECIINGVKTYHTMDNYVVNFGSKVIYNWLLELGLYTQGPNQVKCASHFKVIPWSILQADKESQIAFLAAYLEGDGSVYGSLRWFSSSLDLIQQMQNMLNAMGFSPKITTQDTCYGLYMSMSESQKIYREISRYAISKKIEVRAKVVSNDGVPFEYWRKLISNRFSGERSCYYNDYGKIIQLKNWSNYSTKIDRWNYNISWTGNKTFLYNLKRLSHIGYSKLQTAMSDKYTYSRITKIKKAGIEPVYDISISENKEPSFIANGIIVHNCTRFFNVPVLEVTDKQRYDIKAVVFGTIYEKSAKNLAVTLDQTEEYAQGLIDNLFETFADGKRFIDETHAFGQENLYVESPLGIRRHLWGYLHTRPAVINAMNRRGPNSIIQGVSSNIGIMSIRMLQKILWNFFVKYDIPINWRFIVNFVHDSKKSEVEYCNIPLFLYLLEHCSTTLIHERLRKTFGYNLTVGLEGEFQVGGALSRSKKWDFTRESLYAIIEQETKWQKEELGYKIPADLMDKIDHNWKIISEIRSRELKQSLKSKEPSEIMLMTEKNARSLGLLFNSPKQIHYLAA